MYKPALTAHAVMVVDGGKVLAQQHGVVTSELEGRIRELRIKYGAEATITVDDQPLGEGDTVASHFAANVSDAPVELAMHMLWSSYERSAYVQAWMLERANDFTKQLLDNNRRLAEQTAELQETFQKRMARLDSMAMEHKLMEEEAMARRLSRHIIAKERAEIQAEQPREMTWLKNLVELAGQYVQHVIKERDHGR